MSTRKAVTKPKATRKAPAKKAAPATRPTLAAVPPRETSAAPASPARESARPAPARPAATMNQKDLKHFEHLLLEERQRLVRGLGHIEANVLKRSLRETSGELSGYSFHMADVGTDAMEREKAFHFASAEGRQLLDVDDALRRLYGGAYGACESCGNPVGKERLEVVPHARLCVNCKEKEERAQAGRSR